MALKRESWLIHLFAFQIVHTLNLLYLTGGGGGGGNGGTDFSPSTRETEAGSSLSSRLGWSTKPSPGQSGLYNEILPPKTKIKK